MLLRFILLFFVLLLPCTGLTQDRAIKQKPVTGEARSALVIGNAAYDNAPLANPVNDARDIAAALKKAGFSVDLLLNGNQRKMKEAILKFGRTLRHGGVGLFYFAGHGIQINGINYLIPVNANINNEAEVQYEAVEAGRILSQMQLAGNQLNMVFLDACRNNPYKRAFRSAHNGLAAMDAPHGSLISFATAADDVAADGTGRNGIYTKHLLRQMATRNLELGRMMKLVRRGVQQDTGNRQTPYELSSLTGDFYFIGGTDSDDGVGNTTAYSSSVSSGEEEMWALVKDSGNLQELRYFLAEYPNSSHRGVAKIRIIRLEQKKDGSKPDPAFGRLFVAATPAEARIRILNIKPRYTEGIKLTPGSYEIEVSSKGYKTYIRTIVLNDSKNVTLPVRLQKLNKAPVNDSPQATASSSKKVMDPGGVEQILYRNSYALLIGASDYLEGWPKLPGVKSDIPALEKTLQEHGFTVRTVFDPDCADLETVFKKFVQDYGLEEQNRLLFYFAGHGHTIKQKYGAETAYLVPVDAPDPEVNKKSFLFKALPLSRIEGLATRIDAKHALFLFDSCFSGAIFSLTRDIPASISHKTSRPVRQFIGSCGAGEIVSDESIFLKQLILALKGKGGSNDDGYITASELAVFLTDSVTNYSHNTQHPWYGKIRNQNLDKGDFVFILPGK